MSTGNKSLLVVLVNYGDEQISYLKQVVSELQSFKKYDVDIFVHTDIPLEKLGVLGINEVLVTMDDYEFLPLTCRTTIADKAHKYDYIIYSENDHLWKESHIDKYREYEEILPPDRISGLIQYEENEDCKFYPAYHADFHWDLDSVEVHGDKKFAHFTNVHQASFLISRQKLLDIMHLFDITDFISGKGRYSYKCKVNTEIYQDCFLKKLICISEFEDNLIHHLPNIYINGDAGRIKLGCNDKKMKEELEKING